MFSNWKKNFWKNCQYGQWFFLAANQQFVIYICAICISEFTIYDFQSASPTPNPVAFIARDVRHPASSPFSLFTVRLSVLAVLAEQCKRINDLTPFRAETAILVEQIQNKISDLKTHTRDPKSCLMKSWTWPHFSLRAAVLFVCVFGFDSVPTAKSGVFENNRPGNFIAFVYWASFCAHTSSPGRSIQGPIIPPIVVCSFNCAPVFERGVLRCSSPGCTSGRPGTLQSLKSSAVPLLKSSFRKRHLTGKRFELH